MGLRQVLATALVLLTGPACSVTHGDPSRQVNVRAPTSFPSEGVADEALASGSPYAVTWSHQLLQFLSPAGENASDALEASLDRTWDDAFELTNGSQNAEAHTCRQLLAVDETYEPVRSWEFAVFQDRRARCRAVTLVARAKPSRASALRQFELDGEAPQRLPAALALVVSPDDEQRVDQATTEGKPWNAVEDVHLVSRVSPEEARYGDGISEQDIVVLARGDFDDDGSEDLLLLSHGWLREGSYSVTRLFLVSRELSAKVARLLPVE